MFGSCDFMDTLKKEQEYRTKDYQPKWDEQFKQVVRKVEAKDGQGK